MYLCRKSLIFINFKWKIRKLVNNEGIELLGRQISRYFPNLEELSLTLFSYIFFLMILFIFIISCFQVTSEGLKALARRIGLNLSKLRRLNITITQSESFVKIFLIKKRAQELHEFGLIDFMKRLSRCSSKLTHLRLNISA